MEKKVMARIVIAEKNVFFINLLKVKYKVLYSGGKFT
jgi:hypothetical protein